MPPPADDRLLTYEQVAALVGKDKRTVRRWVNEKRLLPKVTLGGSVWVWESDLLRALGRAPGPTPEQAPDTADEGARDAEP